MQFSTRDRFDENSDVASNYADMSFHDMNSNFHRERTSYPTNFPSNVNVANESFVRYEKDDSSESPLTHLRRKRDEMKDSDANVTDKLAASAEYYFAYQKENAKKLIEYIKERYDDVAPVMKEKIQSAIGSISEYEIPSNIKENVSNSVVSLQDAVEKMNLSESIRSTMTSMHIPNKVQNILMCSNASDFHEQEGTIEFVVDNRSNDMYRSQAYPMNHIQRSQPNNYSEELQRSESTHSKKAKRPPVEREPLISFDEIVTQGTLNTEVVTPKAVLLPEFKGPQSTLASMENTLTFPRYISSVCDVQGDMKMEGRRLFLDSSRSGGIGAVRFYPKGVNNMKLDVKLISPSCGVGILIGVTNKNAPFDLKAFEDGLRKNFISNGFFLSLEDEKLIAQDGTFNFLSRRKINLMQNSVIGFSLEERVMTIIHDGAEFSICSFQNCVALPNEAWLPTIVIVDTRSVPCAKLMLMD